MKKIIIEISEQEYKEIRARMKMKKETNLKKFVERIISVYLSYN